MTEYEWESTSNAQVMLEHLQIYGFVSPSVTPRQLRLLLNAFHRNIVIPERRGQIDTADMVADGVPDDGTWTMNPVSLTHLIREDVRHRPGLFMAPIIRCIFGNPWRQVTRPERNGKLDKHGCPMSIFPTWADSQDVISIARNIYDSRDWSAAPVLADALLEAGLPETVECYATGESHGDRCAGGRIQSPNAQFTRDCSQCNGTGRLPNPILAHLRPKMVTCERCDGDGQAHGSDRPFEWSGPGTYPGTCQQCEGVGIHTVEQVHARGCHVLDMLLNLQEKT